MRVSHQAESSESGHKPLTKQQNQKGNKRLGAICGLAAQAVRLKPGNANDLGLLARECRE